MRRKCKNDAKVTILGDWVMNSGPINCNWKCMWKGSNEFVFGCVNSEVPLRHLGKYI